MSPKVIRRYHAIIRRVPGYIKDPENDRGCARRLVPRPRTRIG